MIDNMKILHTESSEGWGGQELRILEESNLLKNIYGYDCQIAVSFNAEMLRRNPYKSVQIIPLSIGKNRLTGLFQLIR